MKCRICLAVLVIFLSRASAHGATIYVTTLEDKVSSTGGCSLKEAIFSANLHSNLAISGYDADGNALFLLTKCTAGTGDDTIVLPDGAVLMLSKIQDDADNPMGPTATPMITSNITLEANGARFQYVRNVAAYADFDDVPRPIYFRLFAISSVGNLTLKNAYVTGFQTHGGIGGFISISEAENRGGGGGGMGAGGAIFVRGGSLSVINSTFDSNGAIGGDGANGPGGGGGGGLGGDGGGGGCGGGGGGARGSGATSSCPGGGGGTVSGAPDRLGGIICGGTGGSGDHLDGFEPPCDGGGGGSGGIALDSTGLSYNSGNGAKGSYGGGGGSGGDSGGNGGDGGFGGGGGGAGIPSDLTGSRGGTGGFGGGGGIGPNGNVTGTGHPGLGGKFGGDANTQNGGGGAALGGAIFNDSGTVYVANSTFTNNIVNHGAGGGAGTPNAADPGADAGGAIFSRNGSLTVVDVTVSGNQGTGSGAGIAVVEDGLPTSFTLNDTIIANNGQQECFVRGAVSTTAAGNLIMSNGFTPPITPPLSSNCDLSAATADPHLGSLFLNAPGITPTMAIGTKSSAFNAGAGTSLTTDQRGMTRPSMGGYDIGAFELCINKLFIVCILPPSTALTDQLTVAVSPPGAGTTTPAVGKSTELLGSVALITTKPNTGFSFLDWTGNIADPLSAATTVVMNTDQTVTANYIAGTTVLGGNIVSRTGAAYARDWGFNLAVAGVVAAHNAELTSLTLTQTGGPACTPFLLFSLPIQFGDIAMNSSVTQNLFLDFSNCAANARFTAVATLSANGGGLTGAMTQFNQFQ